MRNTVFIALAAATGSMLVASPALAADPVGPSSPSAIERAYDGWVTATETARCEGSLVSRLYTQRAILLATFSKYVKGRAAITDYFDSLTCNPDLVVTTSRITTGRDGSMGYATGLYKFSYTGEDGQAVKVPARFTFVFVKTNHGWLIVNHHSSENPKKH